MCCCKMFTATVLAYEHANSPTHTHKLLLSHSHAFFLTHSLYGRSSSLFIFISWFARSQFSLTSKPPHECNQHRWVNAIFYCWRVLMCSNLRFNLKTVANTHFWSINEDIHISLRSTLTVRRIQSTHTNVERNRAQKMVELNSFPLEILLKST